MAGAREAEAPGEGPRARERGIALEVAAPRRDRARARGQAFQQGGLAAAVLPHQEGDGRPEVEALEVAEERQRERKRRGLPQRPPARRMPVRKSPDRAAALREPARFTRIG